jgi:hypothetical protein
LINWHLIIFCFKSIFSFLFNKSSETKAKEEDEKEPMKSSWQIVLIKFLMWLTLYVIFIRIEFDIIYLIVSLFYLIWSTLGSSRRRRHHHELSAYSVFNPNFEKLQGTFSAEDYDRQLRRGGSPFFSASSS